jgi:NitT/TauT family transport system substrate-binding protein
MYLSNRRKGIKKMKTKSVFLLVLILLLTACSAPAGGESYEEISLKVTLNDNISYAPLLIARAENYFSDYGLNVEFVTFDKSSEAVALLLTGKIDVYAGTLNAGFLNSVYQEPTIKAVADRGHISSTDSCTYQAILIRKDLYESGEVDGPEDLTGLEFAAKETGIHAYLLDSYLDAAGLSAQDLKINDLPDSVLIDAFSAKTISGMVATEPTLSFVLNSGEAVILAETQNIISPLQTGVIAFGKNLLVDHPDVGARFLAAYLKGVKQYNEGKTDRNLQILNEATSETIENLKVGCWPAIREDGYIDFLGVEGFQQWSVANGELDNLVTEEQFWTPAFLADAQKLLQP